MWPCCVTELHTLLQPAAGGIVRTGGGSRFLRREGTALATEGGTAQIDQLPVEARQHRTLRFNMRPEKMPAVTRVSKFCFIAWLKRPLRLAWTHSSTPLSERLMIPPRYRMERERRPETGYSRQWSLDRPNTARVRSREERTRTAPSARSGSQPKCDGGGCYAVPDIRRSCPGASPK
jgi:hypothetical protein